MKLNWTMLADGQIREKGARLPDGRAFVIEPVYSGPVVVSWTLYLVTGQIFEPVDFREPDADAVKDLQAVAEEMAEQMFPLHALAALEEGR